VRAQYAFTEQGARQARAKVIEKLRDIEAATTGRNVARAEEGRKVKEASASSNSSSSSSTTSGKPTAEDIVKATRAIYIFFDAHFRYGAEIIRDVKSGKTKVHYDADEDTLVVTIPQSTLKANKVDLEKIHGLTYNYKPDGRHTSMKLSVSSEGMKFEAYDESRPANDQHLVDKIVFISNNVEQAFRKMREVHYEAVQSLVAGTNRDFSFESPRVVEAKPKVHIPILGDLPTDVGYDMMKQLLDMDTQVYKTERGTELGIDTIYLLGWIDKFKRTKETFWGSRYDVAVKYYDALAKYVKTMTVTNVAGTEYIKHKDWDKIFRKR
jgi:hypothetical protein